MPATLPSNNADPLSKSELRSLIARHLPAWLRACDADDGDSIVLHEASFGTSTHELFLFACAIKYAAAKGKHVLNVKPPDAARAMAVVEGELVASIGENRKLVIFPTDQVPEMARGRGVRLQRYRDGGLCDIKTFKALNGLFWADSAGRIFSLTMKELADWRGNRADAGRLAPKGFPRTNRFSSLAGIGRFRDGE